MAQTRLVLTDLDDTIMSTARKQTHLATCTLTALNKKGEPSSWQNEAQRALWGWLGQFGAVVPVTVRNRAALDRVKLPMSPHAVWNNGASLAINGVLDQEWQAQIQADLDDLHIQGVWEAVHASLKTWLLEHPDLPPTILRNVSQAEFQGRRLHLEIKQPDVGQHVPELVARVRAVVADQLWVYPHYDVVAILPQRVRKENAVARLLEALKPDVTVGVGDSPTDLPFMKLCDTLVMPSQSLMGRLLARHLSETQDTLSTLELK